MNAIQYEKTPTSQSESPDSPPSNQRLMLRETNEGAADWDMSPAELYGCLCHKAERDDSTTAGLEMPNELR